MFALGIVALVLLFCLVLAVLSVVNAVTNVAVMLARIGAHNEALFPWPQPEVEEPVEAGPEPGIYEGGA